LNVVVDANILFAALIKEGVTAEILTSRKHSFFVPEFILREHEKYKLVLQKKTHRNQQDFDKFLNLLKKYLVVIPKDLIAPYIVEAKKYCPDENDIQYFALALKLNCSIWSNDKRLKNQKEIKILNTNDLMNLLE